MIRLILLWFGSSPLTAICVGKCLSLNERDDERNAEVKALEEHLAASR